MLFMIHNKVLMISSIYMREASKWTSNLHNEEANSGSMPINHEHSIFNIKLF